MGDKTINLFISHHGKDEKYIPKVKALLQNKDYEVRDSSIVETEPNKAKDPDYIKTLLRAQIDWAGTMLVLIGPETHTRPWVNWEIEYAAQHGDKRIVGVYLPGATDSDIPIALAEYGDACVAWNSDQLLRAIEGEDIWHDASGRPRPDEGARVTCK